MNKQEDRAGKGGFSSFSEVNTPVMSVDYFQRFGLSVGEQEG